MKEEMKNKKEHDKIIEDDKQFAKQGLLRKSTR